MCLDLFSVSLRDMSNETGQRSGMGWGDGEKWLRVCFCSVTLETHLKSLVGVIVFLCAFVFVLCLRNIPNETGVG